MFWSNYRRAVLAHYSPNTTTVCRRECASVLTLATEGLGIITWVGVVTRGDDRQFVPRCFDPNKRDCLHRAGMAEAEVEVLNRR